MKSFVIILVVMMLSIATTTTYATAKPWPGSNNGAIKGIFKKNQKTYSASQSTVKGKFQKQKVNSKSNSTIKGNFKKVKVTSNSEGAVKNKPRKYRVKVGRNVPKNTVKRISQE